MPGFWVLIFILILGLRRQLLNGNSKLSNLENDNPDGKNQEMAVSSTVSACGESKTTDRCP